ncbi:MAG: oligosaccharide flippase family protein [Patescibacteria group bacterium]
MINKTAIDTNPDSDEVLPTIETGMGEIEAKRFKKKSVSGAISYTLRSLILYGISMFTAVILAGYLSAEEFGVYGIVTQIVALLQFFSDIGLGYALIQQKNKPSLKEYRTVFTIQQILALLIFLTTVFIAMSGVMQEKVGIAGVWVLLALGASFPLSSLKVIPAIILERDLNFSKLIIPNVFEQLVYNAILIYMVINGKGVFSYAYAVIVRSIVGVIVMYLVQSWKIGLALNFKIIKKTLGTALQFQATDFLARIKDQLFYLVLGWWLPLNQFGYITWSKSWSQMPYMLTVQNVVAITFPAFSRLQHDKKRLAKAIEKSLFFITLLIFPMLVGMSVFIIPLTQIFERYQKWQPALITFIFFTLSIAWSAVSTPLTNTLAAIGKISITLRLMIMWTSLTWIITPILLWKFGFNAVAFSAFLISFTSILPVYLTKKYVKFNAWDNVWRQLLAAIIMGVVGVLGLQYWGQSFTKMLIGILIVGFSYLLILALIARKKIILELKSLR